MTVYFPNQDVEFGNLNERERLKRDIQRKEKQGQTTKYFAARVENLTMKVMKCNRMNCGTTP